MLTGCLLDCKHAENIIDLLSAHNVNIMKLQQVTFIALLNNAERENLQKVKLNCLSLEDYYPHIKVQFLLSSISLNQTDNIGIPNPIPSSMVQTGSSISLDNDVCGMVYARPVWNAGEEKILDIIARQIQFANFDQAQISRNKIKTPVVYVFGRPEEKVLLHEGVKFIFKTRLPQTEFKQTLIYLSQLNQYRPITVFCDGICTHIEASILGLNTFVLGQFSADIYLYNSLLKRVKNQEKDLIPVAQIMLGQDQSYSHWNIQDVFAINQKVRMFQAVQEIFTNLYKQATDHFDNHMKENLEPNIQEIRKSY